MKDSINEFLVALHGAIGEGENFRLNITRKGDSLDIFLIPELSGNDEKIPEEAKQIRAALAMPLLMRGMALNDLAGEFANRMQGYGNVRNAASDTYGELLATLNDAAASAKNTINKNTAKATEKTKVVDDMPDSDKPVTPTTKPTHAAEKKVSGGGVLDF